MNVAHYFINVPLLKWTQRTAQVRPFPLHTIPGAASDRIAPWYWATYVTATATATMRVTAYVAQNEESGDFTNRPATVYRQHHNAQLTIIGANISGGANRNTHMRRPYYDRAGIALGAGYFLNAVPGEPYCSVRAMDPASERATPVTRDIQAQIMTESIVNNATAVSTMRVSPAP